MRDVKLTFESHHIREGERLFARVCRDCGEKSGNYINLSIIWRILLRYVYYTHGKAVALLIIYRKAAEIVNTTAQILSQDRKVRTHGTDEKSKDFRCYKCMKTREEN